MNTKVLITAFLCLGMLFTACNDDDDPAKPVVTITELGQGEDHENNHRAIIGGSLHMDVEIVAEAKIDKIKIEIHSEEEHKSAGEHSHWELDTTFSGTGITGLKNLDFHKDLKIGSAAEPGDYHYHIMVIDMEGNTGSDEAELELVEASTNITVTNLNINDNKHDVSKASGSFTIAFDAAVTKGKLVSYSIEAHNHPESEKEEDEYKIIDEVFTDNFKDLTSASVSKTIAIDGAAPKGQYHVEIIINDTEGSPKVVSGHIDLED